jgi:phosphoglycerol transferase MdoB-like AlkP superfamily enzyme
MTTQKKSMRSKADLVSYGHMFINVFAVVFIAFTVHRFFNTKFLSEAVTPDSPSLAFMVGSLSDIWVGFLMTFVITPITYGAYRLDKNLGILAKCFFFLILTGTLSAHQGYVEFFRFQVEPFHLSYLSDVQFIDSNAASFLTRETLILLVISGCAASLALLRKQKKIELKSWAVVMAFAFLALIAHNRNIHYRVQWFIPENLQTNLFESLYLRSAKLGNTAKLLPTDFTAAKTFYSKDRASLSDDRYQSTIFSSSIQKNPPTHQIAEALKQTFKEHVDRGAKPAIIIALLESLRPSETGVFSQNQKSLTPRLDQLAQSGIWFRRAFSTGSVTRGGQEATLCGNFSGRNTSLMRNFDSLPYRCITDVLNNETVAKYWYHGGDGRFDGQEAFWRRHNVKDFMTVKSFPLDAARTGWGVGDLILFKEAANKIMGLSQQNTSFSLGMLLSVTNHIPWQMPGNSSQADNSSEPWFLTTTYTDTSVGALVDELKKTNIWQSTLLFVISDHGNKTKPHADLYKESRNSNQLLQSHVNLIVSGGITEEALERDKQPPMVFDHFVGQADVATTIANIIALEPYLSMGKNLFEETSSYPVLSQTEEGIYIPALDQLVSYSEINKSLPESTSPDWIYRFHYKAALEYLLEMRSAP